jgi:hypothetical protein
VNLVDADPDRPTRPPWLHGSFASRTGDMAGNLATAFGRRSLRCLAEGRVIAHLALHRLFEPAWGREGVSRAARQRAFLEATRHLVLREGMGHAIVSASPAEFSRLPVRTTGSIPTLSTILWEYRKRAKDEDVWK